jgi:hypothetical protein
VRNVVLENEWNVECEWLPSQTNLESGRILCMISRRVVVSVADVGKEYPDFSDSSSLGGPLGELSSEKLSSDDSDLSSLVDLTLISVPSLFLVGDLVRLLGNSSSELDRVGFGLVLAFFVADGVTLPFFDADGSCRLLLDVLAVFCLLFLTLNPLSGRMVMDCLASTFGSLTQ